MTINFTYACHIQDVAAITVSKEFPNIITSFTMNEPGKWIGLNYGNESVDFSEKIELPKESLQRPRFVQSVKIPISKSQKSIASEIAIWCQIVLAHEIRDGLFIVQGIELDVAAARGFTGTKIRDTRASFLSETPNCFLDVDGQSTNKAPICFMTSQQFETL